MAQAPYLSTQKQYKGKYIVKDLFTKNMSSKSTGDDLFSMVETSPNGRDGIFDTRKEALEAIEERKLETGRGLSSKEINKKYSKYIKAEGFNKWEETDDAAKKRIKQAYRYDKGLGYQKVGRTKINPKTVNLLEKKKPINPRTGLPYTQEEFINLTSGQKQKLSLRMKGLKRKDVKYKPRQGYYPEKDANRLINYMKIAAERQEKANIPVEERTYTNVFDKNKKFVGVNDIRQNQLYTHIDYDLSKTNALAGKIITQHPDYEPMQDFFKSAKRFKYESPDKLLGSYFSKYERVPTYNEIFTFFTTDRNASIKVFKNNQLTLQHQELISKEPTKNFQLLTQIKNTQAATIMNKLNRGEISPQLADYELKKIGAAQEGLGVAAETITPGKGLGVAKREAVKLFKDAVKVNPNVVSDLTSKLQIKLLKAVKSAPESCGVILSKATGGIANSCAEAITKDPVGSAEKLKNLDAQSGPLAKVKNIAINFLKSPGLRTFGIAGAVGAAGAGLVKQFNNNDPTTYLSNEDQQKSMLVDMATDSVSINFDRPAILDYQLPALGAEAAAGLAVTAPSTIKASKSRAFGIEKKRVAPGTIKTGARVLGRGLASLGTPLGLLPMEAMNITSQIAEGDSPLDIATDPLNYLGATFAEPATKIAARGVNPKIATAMRLGMSPGALRLLSRAGGIGLGASLGIMGLQKLSDL
jgi:hypothetical protein